MQAEQLRLFAEIEDKHWWFRARREILRKLLHRLIPAPPPRVVVDIGCGTGGNLGSLGGNYECIGVDSSEVAIDLARQRYPRVRFTCGEAPRDVEADLARADAVLLMDVIEHVDDDSLFLSQILAATRPGAQVIIFVPAEMALWSPHDETVLHRRRYDRARLAAAWAGLPVRVRLLSPHNVRLYPLIRAARWISRRRGRSVGRAGTDFTSPPGWVNETLFRLYAGEAGRLLQGIDQPTAPRLANGVSLAAVLERR